MGIEEFLDLVNEAGFGEVIIKDEDGNEYEVAQVDNISQNLTLHVRKTSWLTKEEMNVLYERTLTHRPESLRFGQHFMIELQKMNHYVYTKLLNTEYDCFTETSRLPDAIGFIKKHYVR